MRSPWMSSVYKIDPNIKVICRVVADNKYFVIINPEVGSWIVLTEEEYKHFKVGNLDEIQYETLYMRSLATTLDGEHVNLDFPKPAEYPSVLVVNITTRCNLRCSYCFANCDPATGENMSERIMELSIRQMLTFPSKTITFELQGGEPTLFIDGLKKFIEISENLRPSHDKTIKYRTVTNCTLITQEFIDLVKKYDVTVGISLDGPKEMTDLVRLHPDGRGAFDDIMIGINRLRNNGILVDGAICTIGQHNVNNPKRIVEFFNEMNISFKPRPANILGRELMSQTTSKPREWAHAFKIMHSESKGKEIDNFSVHIFEENVYTPIRDYICLRYPCGAAREVISVNPNGDIVPCDGFKSENEFVMGNLLTESIVDMINKTWVQTLRARTHKDIPKCSKCMFKSMCCSCCYSAFGAYGTIWREDPHCIDRKKIFLFLIDEWIQCNMVDHKTNP